MVVIVRLDLDKYDLGKLNDLIRDQIITMSEATESRAFKGLNEYQQYLQIRFWKQITRRDYAKSA